MEIKTKLKSKDLLSCPYAELEKEVSSFLREVVLKEDPFLNRLLSLDPDLIILGRESSQKFKSITLKFLDSFDMFPTSGVLKIRFSNKSDLPSLLSKGLEYKTEHPVNIFEEMLTCVEKIIKAFEDKILLEDYNFKFFFHTLMLQETLNKEHYVLPTTESNRLVVPRSNVVIHINDAISEICVTEKSTGVKNISVPKNKVSNKMALAELKKLLTNLELGAMFQEGLVPYVEPGPLYEHYNLKPINKIPHSLYKYFGLKPEDSELNSLINCIQSISDSVDVESILYLSSLAKLHIIDGNYVDVINTPEGIIYKTDSNEFNLVDTFEEAKNAFR